MQLRRAGPQAGPAFVQNETMSHLPLPFLFFSFFLYFIIFMPHTPLSSPNSESSELDAIETRLYEIKQKFKQFHELPFNTSLNIPNVK
jgi:hypothetical protein